MHSLDPTKQTGGGLTAQALGKEGKTDVFKCLRVSQPYGIGGLIRFWSIISIIRGVADVAALSIAR